MCLYSKRVNAFLRVVHNTPSLFVSNTHTYTSPHQQFTNNYFFEFTAAAGSFSSSSPPITSFATLTSDSHRLALTLVLLPYASSTLRSVGDSDVRSVISACSPAAPSGSSPVIIGDWHTFCSHCPAERPPIPAVPTLPLPAVPDNPPTSGELSEDRDRVFCPSGSTVSPTICDTRGDPLRSACSRSPAFPPSLAGRFTGETPMAGSEEFHETPAVSPIPAPGV